MNTHKNAPRLLGFMFLFVLAGSALSEIPLGPFDISIVGPPENIAETMTMISASPKMMRLSIVGYLFEALGMVLLAVLLYTALKRQNKIIARWAFGLWIVQAVFVAVRQISSFSLLNVSQQFVQAGGADSITFQTLGRLFYDSFQFVYSSQMIFYTVGGFLFYYLLYKSKLIPTLIPLFGLVVASLGFIGQLLALFGYDVPLFLFLIPILPFELTIGIWLMIKGFNPSAIVSESAKTDINEV
jgi:hypothetical protein